MRREKKGERKRKRYERGCKNGASVVARIKGRKRVRVKRMANGETCRDLVSAYLLPGSPISIDSTPPTCWLSSTVRIAHTDDLFPLFSLEVTSVNP